MAIAAGLDDERRRECRHTPAVGRFRIRIQQDREGELQIAHVGLEQPSGRAAVHRDGEDQQPALPVAPPQRFQRRHLERAGVTPRRPEVQDDELVAVVGQRRPGLVERGERERRGLLAFLELDDAGLLEVIRARGAVTRLLARAPDRQEHEQRAQQRDRQRGAEERLAPVRPEDRVRRPASHASPGSRGAPATKLRRRSSPSP